MPKLDYVILDLLESTARNIKAHPLNLGGVSGSAGGVGGPPGGFIGWLPQTRVAYDQDELEVEPPTGSGSLLDNLNHIRYRLGTLESGGSLIVMDDDTPATFLDVNTIHFSGAGVLVTDLGGGHVSVGITATGSGGGGSPLVVMDADFNPTISGVDTIIFSGFLVEDLGSGDVRVTASGFGSNEFYIDQSAGTSDTYGILSGAVDTSNTDYTVSKSSYITKSLSVFLNGQLQTQGTAEDWIEVSPAAGTFRFNTAPLTGDLITVMYQRVASTSGNADTVDGLHASEFALSSAIREKLTASRTYYVRTDGSNSNTGLTNTAGGAFLTIQKAIDTVATLDISAQTVVIQVADGTYTGAVSLKNVTGFAAVGNLTIQGNVSTPANVIISTTSTDAITATGLSTIWRIESLKVQTTTSGNCITVRDAVVYFGALNFGACAAYHLSCLSGSIVCDASYSVTGGATRHWNAQIGGRITVQTFTITLTGTPAFSGAWAFCNISGVIVCNGNTYTGSATGKIYDVATNGVVFSTITMPGSIAGTTATGGQYA